MPTPFDTKDTTTVLNPGVGGDSMDESRIIEQNLTTGAVDLVGKRPRVCIGGEIERDVIVEPENEGDGSYSLPVVDRDVRQRLANIEAQMTRIADLLEVLVTSATG